MVFTLAACGDRSAAPVNPDLLQSGDLTTVYVATNRSLNAEGYFDYERETTLSFFDTKVSIPPVHQVGDAPRYNKKPNPKKHFVLASQDKFASQQAFVNGLRSALAKLPPENRELTLYIHGYYNGYSDSVFRMAQMHEDFEMRGVPIAFSWPSAAKPTGYIYDRDSALFSRDDLEQLLYLLPQTGARNILIIAHSMGALLTIETLRQMEESRPGWAKRNITSVVLMSPDISVDVFKTQADDIDFPTPFIVIASKNDKILQLSKKINLNEDRLGLGNSVEALAKYPIMFVDVSEFSEDTSNQHFVAAESPALISLMSSVRDLPGYSRSDQISLLGGITATPKHLQNAIEITLAPEDNDPH